MLIYISSKAVFINSVFVIFLSKTSSGQANLLLSNISSKVSKITYVFQWNSLKERPDRFIV